MEVQTVCADDLMNLWYAILAALFRPGAAPDPTTRITPGQQIFLDLEARGALGANIRVSQAVSIQPVHDGQSIVRLEATGLLEIDVRNILIN
jgi:hypothetical protein